ncbi:hypothetical protein HDV03_005538 [Kappamyces sp. JEL0829]|nr:hypothetical protein HDV03_005538 [Kappamyces sp. JEL0829]KAJ3348038.1 hypothetical protein HDU91_006643 [Kappamyces sp. JEL0680]
MGRRSNPLGNRVGRMINWPSNVNHPALSSYIKHIFQDCLVASPGIRSSTTGMWINVTLLPTTLPPSEMSHYSHPKISNPQLDFRGAVLEKAAGRLEWRTKKLAKGHHFYKALFQDVSFKSLLAAGERNDKVHEALQIYRDTPIHLRVNVITNPLLNADIMAQQIAHAVKNEVPVAKIFKSYLKSMST